MTDVPSADAPDHDAADPGAAYQAVPDRDVTDHDDANRPAPDRESSNRQAPDHDATEIEAAGPQATDHQAADRAAPDHQAAHHQAPDHDATEIEAAGPQATDHQAADRAGPDHQAAHHQASDRDATEIGAASPQAPDHQAADRAGPDREAGNHQAADRADLPRSPLVELLGLRPHVEGGWFRETWRTEGVTIPDGYPGARPFATGIHFLLHPGERSAWHRVRSDELWLWHRGGPLVLALGGAGEMPSDRPEKLVLGAAVESGEHPQVLVPAGCWQAAEPLGDEPVLVSCVVAPGFAYEDFELLEGEDEDER
ncbi:cupin domain-containing protein [Streptomyces sp. ODS05-4]|uniref:cupin domain-containing protein n=1 Tax=Streptomyces sp. ODS05-4 TaxID=2944939 RepID=UPI00210A3844|nr:cupin domain-containing protein [Streptomyces sp. ODS05-4]